MQPDSHNDSIDAQIKKIEDMRAKFLEQERTSSADRLALNQAVDKLEALLSGDSEYPQIRELGNRLENERLFANPVNQCQGIMEFIQGSKWGGLTEGQKLAEAVDYFTNLVYHEEKDLRSNMGSQDFSMPTIESTKQALIKKLNNLPESDHHAALIKRVNDASEEIAAIRGHNSRRPGHTMPSLDKEAGVNTRPHQGGDDLSGGDDPREVLRFRR